MYPSIAPGEDSSLHMPGAEALSLPMRGGGVEISLAQPYGVRSFVTRRIGKEAGQATGVAIDDSWYHGSAPCAAALICVVCASKDVSYKVGSGVPPAPLCWP